jgi:hypothetical protein
VRQAPVAGDERAAQARQPSHLRHPACGAALQGGLQLPDERISRIGVLEIMEHPRAAIGIQSLHRRLDQDAQCVGAILHGIGAPRLDRASRQEHEDERYVDNGDGGLEEVIVVPGHELPDFVDEGAEADAADDGGEGDGAAVEEGEEQDDGGRHQHAAPEHVADVVVAASQLRVAREMKEEADQKHSRDGCRQEGFEVLSRVEIAQGAAGPGDDVRVTHEGPFHQTGCMTGAEHGGASSISLHPRFQIFTPGAKPK